MKRILILSLLLIIWITGCAKPGENIFEAISKNDRSRALALIEKEKDINVLFDGCPSSVLDIQSFPRGLPLDGKFDSTFGWRKSPFGFGRDFHTGIDILATEGSDIKATADGSVESATWSGGYGYMVKIKHKNSFETIYGHCSTTLVKPGDFIKRGQIIAKSGNTGSATMPHCHYEIRVSGVAKNPDLFIAPYQKKTYPATALHYAIVKGNSEIVKMLLNKKANLRESDYFGIPVSEYANIIPENNATIIVKSIILPDGSNK